MQWWVRWVRRLWRHPIIVLVLGTMIGWALEQGYAALFAARGISGLVTLALSVISVVLIYWLAYGLWQRFVPMPPMLGTRPPMPHRGLILLFSNEVTFAKAVEHHQLRLSFLCLIVTDESVEAARCAVQNLVDAGRLTGVQLREERVHGAWNPDDVALAVERAIRQGSDLGLDKSDLICDVTGGTKAMATGALLTCLAEGLPVQMVPADYDKALKVLHPRDVIQLRLD